MNGLIGPLLATTLFLGDVGPEVETPHGPLSGAQAGQGYYVLKTLPDDLHHHELPPRMVGVAGLVTLSISTGLAETHRVMQWDFQEIPVYVEMDIPYWALTFPELWLISISWEPFGVYWGKLVQGVDY